MHCALTQGVGLHQRIHEWIGQIHEKHEVDNETRIGGETMRRHSRGVGQRVDGNSKDKRRSPCPNGPLKRLIGSCFGRIFSSMTKVDIVQLNRDDMLILGGFDDIDDSNLPDFFKVCGFTCLISAKPNSK